MIKEKGKFIHKGRLKLNAYEKGIGRRGKGKWKGKGLIKREKEKVEEGDEKENEKAGQMKGWNN